MVCVTQQRKVQIWIGCRDQGIHYFLIFKTVPQRGSFWQPVTGHVEVGESDQEAALRELKEETGFECSNLRSLDFQFEFERGGEKFVETCFFADLGPVEVLPPPKICSKEHSDYEWVLADDAHRRVKHQSNKQALGKLKSRNLL